MTPTPSRSSAASCSPTLAPRPRRSYPAGTCSSRSTPGMTSASPCSPATGCNARRTQPTPVHAEWLHGVYGWWLAQQSGEEVPSWRKAMMRPHQRIGFTEFANGVFKRRIVEGTTEDDDIWKIGHPWVFPNILRSTTGTTSTEFQIRVPIDDHNTLHVVYTRYQFPPEVDVPPQQTVPYYEIPLYIDGKLNVEVPLPQDFMGVGNPGPRRRPHPGALGRVGHRRDSAPPDAHRGHGHRRGRRRPHERLPRPCRQPMHRDDPGEGLLHPDRNQARMIYHGHQRYNPAIDEIIAMFPG